MAAERHDDTTSNHATLTVGAVAASSALAKAAIEKIVALDSKLDDLARRLAHMEKQWP